MDLEGKLSGYGVAQLYPKDQDFLQTFPDSDEIIFDDRHKGSKRMLYWMFFKSIDPEHAYQLRSSTQKPANFITLHLRTGTSGK